MKDIISKRRKELGLTQQELADKLYVSDKVVSKWETGKSIPDTAILVDLAKVLEITVNDLLSVEQENKANVSVANNLMLDTKYKNLFIIFIAIQIVSALLFIFGRMIIDDRENAGYIMLAIGVIVELVGIVFFLVSRNNLIFKYTKIIKIDKKYLNLVFWFTYFIIMIVSAVFIHFHGLLYSEQIIAFLIVVFIILIPFLILSIWNKKRKLDEEK